jgi:hypothetical protein
MSAAAVLFPRIVPVLDAATSSGVGAGAAEYGAVDELATQVGAYLVRSCQKIYCVFDEVWGKWLRCCCEQDGEANRLLHPNPTCSHRSYYQLLRAVIVVATTDLKAALA